ncbi:glycerophosphodiester phosphodiesterase family protein [Anatilimnocola floriformis]|uniref:glycerophosphodiester phosphodiesterase family protein n=1 Tax=Anatilimnocola floriformis TaxID=2948575 RepID=UPI0020C3842C|nr:glycerophosphodiester phosphodiesterase family protein [Anatilimnocola floriformis]
MVRSLPPTFFWALARVRRRWLQALLFVFAFAILRFTIFTPLAAGALRLCLSRWGRASIGNFEIASFLMNPSGIVALLAVGTLLLTTHYFELSGLIRILASDRLHWWSSLRSSSGLLPRLLEVGLRQLVVYLLLALPFVAAIGLTWWCLWSTSDINGLVILRPPRFWWGAGIAAALLILYFLFAAQWFLRWLLAVPILCVEPGRRSLESLQESHQRSRGRLIRFAFAVGVWGAVQFTLSLLVLGFLHWLFQITLDREVRSLQTASLVGGAVVLINAAVTGLLGAISSLMLAAVVLSLYHDVTPIDAGEADRVDADAGEQPDPWWLARSAVWTVAFGLLTVLSILSARSLVADVRLSEKVEITAHRAGGSRGPENTIAALKQAISDLADWCEIDVQLTADNAIVVMHDTDLARVGGGRKQVGQTTLAEIQKLDVGSSFAPRYKGEKIPTLPQFLAVARNRMKLNIELKPHNKSDDEQLTRRVIEAIQAANMTDQCRICSQSYAAIQHARKLEPMVPIGFIVATAIGDPTRLNVDFLMVKQNLATRDFVDKAHARGIQIHAWTVNNPADVAPLLDSGADNLITDDPVMIWEKIEELRKLDSVERVLLRVRHAVGQ